MRNGFQKFISGKGFYLALAVCLAGAGAAAWVAVDKTIENIETTPLSETPQVQQQADSAPAEQKLDNIAHLLEGKKGLSIRVNTIYENEKSYQVEFKDAATDATTRAGHHTPSSTLVE